MNRPPAAASIIRVYYSLTATYTLSVSFVWGINTLFLMDAGLDIFQVMLVNAAFTAGMVLFEVPTGVVADTVGRKVSFLLCLSVILVTTLLYVAAGHYRWGLLPFVGISILVGLGFTFFTGAVDAWLVDALQEAGYDGSTDRVFAGGQTVFAASMFVGAAAGGALGQVHLSLPYLARAGMLVPTFLIALFTMKDYGFTPRPLKASRFAAEARKVFVEGVAFGWRDPVIRMCVLAAFVQGLFFIYGWYSWQRYFLDLLERELVWVAGTYSALVSLAMIAGNQIVKRLFPNPEGKRASILAWTSVIRGTTVVAAGLIGILLPAGHRGVWAFIGAAILYLVFAVSFGLSTPVRSAYINRRIPSAQRATVLSMDSLFQESGAVVGQTGLGYISRTAAIPLAWAVGGVLLFAGYPIYRRAGRLDDEPPSSPPG